DPRRPRGQPVSLHGLPVDRGFRSRGRGSDASRGRGTGRGRAMIPAAFAYDRATTLDEALTLLHDGGPETKLMAGGQSLLPLMKLRLARPERVLDIGRLADLPGVREL